MELNGIKVAILCTDGVEQSELVGPREALDDAGAQTVLVSPNDKQIEAWKHFDAGDKFKVDMKLSEADADDFDALVLPGGVANPDQLRINNEAVNFVRAFVREGKPIAAICHGPWTLIEADGVRGKKLTSWPSIRTDLRNAGAIWGDEKVIRDSNLVTSRKPSDLPDFNREMIKLFAERRVDVGAQRVPTKESTAPGAQV